MSDRFNDIKRALKSGVRNQLQARNLAREASTRLDPEAAEARDRLDEAFGQIPIADQFRGESDVARHAAIEALEELDGKSRRPKKQRRRSKPNS
jgi:hypothetical protein